MFATRRQETDEPTREGFDVTVTPIGIEDPQLPAGLRLPCVIQIQDQRDPALIFAPQLIDVWRVARSWRIPRIVHLEIEQPQEPVAVQIEAQLLEIVQ